MIYTPKKWIVPNATYTVKCIDVTPGAFYTTLVLEDQNGAGKINDFINLEFSEKDESLFKCLGITPDLNGVYDFDEQIVLGKEFEIRTERGKLKKDYENTDKTTLTDHCFFPRVAEYLKKK